MKLQLLAMASFFALLTVASPMPVNAQAQETQETKAPVSAQHHETKLPSWEDAVAANDDAVNEENCERLNAEFERNYPEMSKWYGCWVDMSGNWHFSKDEMN